MGVLNFTVGFIMLVVGRQAYPFFVGGMGYLVGSYLLERVPVIHSEFNQFVFPMIVALIGVLLGVAIQRVAVGIAGFLAGGYLAYMLPTVLRGAEQTQQTWVILAVGAVSVGLLIMSFDFFLVSLSSITGATMIVQELPTESFSIVVLFMVFVFFGMISQYIILQYGEPYPD